MADIYSISTGINGGNVDGGGVGDQKPSALDVNQDFVQSQPSSVTSHGECAKLDCVCARIIIEPDLSGLMIYTVISKLEKERKEGKATTKDDDEK